MDTFYITTPLYYVNARPHLGHTYTTLVADCLSRYKRMQGCDVCFLTGTDEHGQNIERAAATQGVSPEVLADRNAGAYRKLWSRFGVDYDRFIRTTSESHYAAATEVFQRAFDNGFIYKGEYSGWYCIPCNLFAPEAESAPDCDVCQVDPLYCEWRDLVDDDSGGDDNLGQDPGSGNGGVDASPGGGVGDVGDGTDDQDGAGPCR